MKMKYIFCKEVRLRVFKMHKVARLIKYFFSSLKIQIQVDFSLGLFLPQVFLQVGYFKNVT